MGKEDNGSAVESHDLSAEEEEEDFFEKQRKAELERNMTLVKSQMSKKDTDAVEEEDAFDAIQKKDTLTNMEKIKSLMS